MTRAERSFDVGTSSFHLEALIRIERRQVIEVNLMADLFRIVEIDRVDLQQSEIALAFLRSTNGPFNRVASLQRETADLGGRDVDIIRAWQVVAFAERRKPKPS